MSTRFSLRSFWRQAKALVSQLHLQAEHCCALREASRLEAIAISLEAMAISLEAVASRLASPLGSCCFF